MFLGPLVCMFVMDSSGFWIGDAEDDNPGTFQIPSQWATKFYSIVLLVY